VRRAPTCPSSDASLFAPEGVRILLRGVSEERGPNNYVYQVSSEDKRLHKKKVVVKITQRVSASWAILLTKEENRNCQGESRKRRSLKET